MTELVRKDTTTDLQPVSSGAAARLVEWAQAAHSAHQLATALVQTAFVPQQYRGKAGEATAAILAGAELGFDPLASLRAFDNIQGTVAPKAITLRAVAQAHGHEIEVIDETDEYCTVQYRRKGSERWQELTWNMAQARALGLAGKDNWKKQPRAMLVARATAEAARRVASDAILGIAYSSEELRDHPEPVTTPRRVTAAEITGKSPKPVPDTSPPDTPAEDEPQMEWPTVAQPGAEQ